MKSPVSRIRLCYPFYFFVSLVVLISGHASAQDSTLFKWVKRLPQPSCWISYADVLTASDGAGNTYSTASFCGTIDADPGTGVFSLTGNNVVGTTAYNDVYLIKLQANGDFAWAKTIEFVYHDNATAITVDAAGNVYTSGFNEKGYQNYNSYVNKYDTDGNLLWKKTFLSASGVVGRSLKLDKAGNVILAGGFAGTTDFDPGAGTFNLTSKGDSDVCIVKLDNDGNLLWAKSTGGTAFESGITLGLDGSDNITVSGQYSATAAPDMDPGAGSFILPAPGTYCQFVLRLDNAGNFLWAKGIGSAKPLLARSMTTDASGNIFLIGHFNGTLDIDPGAATFEITAADPNTPDIFLMRLDADGSFAWGSGFGAADSDEGRAIAMDREGNIYITGFFNYTVDFDPGPGEVNLVSSGQRFYPNLFFAKYTADGKLLWAQRMGGSATARVHGHSITFDAAADVILSGSFSRSADFDVGPCKNELTETVEAAFVLKVSTDASGAPTITSVSPVSGLAGTPVTITGTNFSATRSENKVEFNSYSANVSASTTTTISATVPAGASGTVYIRVTINCVSATLNNAFVVTPPVVPTITSFAPASGAVGTTVTIIGTNFSTTPANNLVRFNGTTAVASASTATSITTKVPNGATTGKITVKIGANTATSATDFTVTVPGAIAITTQPQNTQVCEEEPAILSVVASGANNLKYQWQFSTTLNGSYADISNGGGYTGATTPSLNVETVAGFGAGFYRVKISSDATPDVFSDKVALTIDTSPACGNHPPEISTTTLTTAIEGNTSLSLETLLSDEENNIDLSSLRIKSPPESGAPAYIDENYRLFINYEGIAFSGTDRLVIEVCDLAGACAEQEIQIEVGGDIIVFNALSPNGDEKNELLFLQSIDVLESTRINKVTIFNRWGDIVFETTDYNNTTSAFRGRNKNGDLLPGGTYFYKVEFPSGRKTLTGFIALRK